MWLDKINEFKKKSGKTTEEISKLSDIPIGTLNKIFSGQTKDPKLGTIKAIVYSLGYTLDDLDGKDSLSLYDNLSNDENLILIDYRKLDFYGKKLTRHVIDIELERIEQEKQKEIEQERIKNELRIKNHEDFHENQTFSSIYYSDIPVSAGDGYYSMDIADAETVELKTPPPRGTSFIIRVTGDSMEPLIHHGDKIFIKSQKDVEIGEIGIFIIDGQFYIKKRGEHELISLNPKYPPVVIREYDNVYCKGKFLDICSEDFD